MESFFAYHCSDITDDKLPTMRNCKEKDIVIWTLFGEKDYTAVFATGLNTA